MSLSKIQIIKLLREVKPGLGLKEAKDLVDSYEVRSFEDRVVRALGEDARQELYTWARLYAAQRGMRYPVKEYRYEVEDRSWVPETDGDTYETVSETDLLPTCRDDCCRPQV